MVERDASADTRLEAVSRGVVSAVRHGHHLLRCPSTSARPAPEQWPWHGDHVVVRKLLQYRELIGESDPCQPRITQEDTAKKLAMAELGLPGRRYFACKITLCAQTARNVDRPAFWPSRQLLTRLSRIVGASIVLAAAAGLAACTSGTSTTPPARTAAALSGGDLVVSFRTEPRSFNRLVARDTSTDLVST